MIYNIAERTEWETGVTTVTHTLTIYELFRRKPTYLLYTHLQQFILRY